MFIRFCKVCGKEFSFRSRGKERDGKRKFCSLICCNNFKKGKLQSEETKKKRSESMKGKNCGEKNGMFGVHRYGKDAPGYRKIAWNKNIHIQINTGKTHFKKGQTPWNINLPPEEQPAYKNPEDRITLLNAQIRQSSLYTEWRDWIFGWDNYTCQHCGKYGGVLRAHHIKQFADIVKKNNIKSLEEALMCNSLWDVSNGITYCEDCHDLLKNKGGMLKWSIQFSISPKLKYQ